MAMSERLLDYREVGRRLGVCRTQIWRMIHDGQLPEPLRMGRLRRWRESDIDAWIRDLAAAQANGDPGASDDA